VTALHRLRPAAEAELLVQSVVPRKTQRS
jgi:hypothetical protein